MELIVNDLSKTIRGSHVLDKINLHLTGGSVCLLEGCNGSGKTMLMRAIAGLIRPTSGYIEIDKKILGKDLYFPPSLGMLIENPSFIGKYSGMKNLLLIARIKGTIDSARVEETIASVGLDPDDNRPYRKYSLGMKQRLGIACAIMEKPDLIMLDEPFNALDDSGMQLIETIIRKYKEDGSLVIIASHNLEQVSQLADLRFRLSEGKCVTHV